jgi:hypothetical protein
MVTPEDIMLRRKLKVQIVSEIERVVKSILNDTPKSEENQSLTPPPNPLPVNCVLNFLFPLKTFHLLQDNNVIPESVQGMRVKYELDSNRLLVQVMPSPAHDAAANAWNDRIAHWSRNGGARPKTLMQCGQGRMFSV